MNLASELREERPRGLLVQRSKLLAVVFKATADNYAADHDFFDVLRPVDHRADAGRGWCTDPQNTDRRQVLALNDGVCTLGRTEHGLMDLCAVDA